MYSFACWCPPLPCESWVHAAPACVFTLQLWLLQADLFADRLISFHCTRDLLELTPAPGPVPGTSLACPDFSPCLGPPTWLMNRGPLLVVVLQGPTWEALYSLAQGPRWYLTLETFCQAALHA